MEKLQSNTGGVKPSHFQLLDEDSLLLLWFGGISAGRVFPVIVQEKDLKISAVLKSGQYLVVY